MPGLCRASMSLVSKVRRGCRDERRHHRGEFEVPMIIDFQQHYTPAEMLKGDPKALTAQVDERGNPNYLLNPLLADLSAHVKMMDHAGIDMGVLTCGVGFDQPDLKICRAINDRMAQAEM